MLTTHVCGFEGITRFILGLYDDIEIIESDELKEFVKNKIKKIAK
jgi:predicted DNA-binding transcriptional regulator YafY